jgi:hypothetical protein
MLKPSKLKALGALNKLCNYSKLPFDHRWVSVVRHYIKDAAEKSRGLCPACESGYSLFDNVKVCPECRYQLGTNAYCGACIKERKNPAPDKTGFEEWYQKYCDESELIEDRIVDIRAAWNAALSQKEGERCPDMKNCNKGDVLSPYKPHEILAECTKYPKQCKGGAKQ